MFETLAAYRGSGFAPPGGQTLRCKHEIRRSILRKLIALLSQTSLGASNPS
jgi:hypothetical protein